MLTTSRSARPSMSATPADRGHQAALDDAGADLAEQAEAG